MRALDLVFVVAVAVLVIGVLVGWFTDPGWEIQRRIWRRVLQGWKRAWPANRGRP
jgi:hypothetical protein